MSKAFLKSMNLMYTGDCHSNDCSSMMRSVAIWSMQDLPALKPACSSLNVLFTAVFSRLSSSILVRTLLGIDRSWIPLQLWQSAKSPFLGSLTLWPVFHSVWIIFLFPDVLEQSLHYPCWCCRVTCFYVWWMFYWQEATELLLPAFQLIHWFGKCSSI